MAFAGKSNNNTILTILNGSQKFAESISPLNITASGDISSSGSISVSAGELLPLTVKEADGSPINTEVHVLVFPNASVVSSGNQTEVIFPIAASGTIVGPSGSTTDNALVRWDGTSGTVIQNSNATLTDGGFLTLASGISAAGDITSSQDVNATGDVNGTNGVFTADVSAQRVILPQVTVNGTYQEIADAEYFVLVASGLSSIVLPSSPVVGQVHVVKDAGGLAGSSTITVLGSGANIDGVASFSLINNYAANAFMWNGTEWSAF